MPRSHEHFQPRDTSLLFVCIRTLSRKPLLVRQENELESGRVRPLQEKYELGVIRESTCTYTYRIVSATFLRTNHAKFSKLQEQWTRLTMTRAHETSFVLVFWVFGLVGR